MDALLQMTKQWVQTQQHPAMQVTERVMMDWFLRFCTLKNVGPRAP